MKFSQCLGIILYNLLSEFHLILFTITRPKLQKSSYTDPCKSFLTLRLFRAASAPIIVCTIVINFYFLYIVE